MIEEAEKQGIQLFLDQRETPYIMITSECGSINTIRRLRSNPVKYWLSNLLWKAQDKAPGSEAINSTLNLLSAGAWDNGIIPLQNRVAWDPDENAIWIDLADWRWRAVKVNAEGWKIHDRPPILFRRYKHMKPLPEPEIEGTASEIFDFANLRDPEEELLFLVTLVSYFVPGVPHVVIIAHGPQGSGKTYAMKAARSIIDPSLMDTLTLPRNQSQLVQQLDHHYFPPYDNIGTLTSSISDVLCRAVTGTGVSKRKLYTDEDDIIFQYHRCIGLTGINIAAQKGDLLERSILLGFETIDQRTRLTEQELNNKLADARPRMFAGLLDLLSKAMAIYPTVKAPKLFRMADFTKWGIAITKAMGLDPAIFLNTYQKNIDEQYLEAIRANVIAEVLLTFMLTTDGMNWTGTYSQLYSELNETAESMGINPRQKAYPKNSQVLSRRLNELSPSLPAAGYRLTTGRSKEGRKVSIYSVHSVHSDTGDTMYANDAIPGDNTGTLTAYLKRRKAPPPTGDKKLR